VIFVKLWQFDLDDRTQVRLDTNTLVAVKDVSRAGVSAIPLFQDACETVSLEHWTANAKIEQALSEGWSRWWSMVISLKVMIICGGMTGYACQ
jgi:hypothetical protein